MTRGQWRALWRIFDGSRATVRLALLLSVTQAMLIIPVALLVQRVFDTVLPHRDVTGLLLCGAAILLLYLGAAAIGLLTSYLVLRGSKASITQLRGVLLERLYRLPQVYYDRVPTAQLQTVVVQDTEQLDVMANALVGNLLPALAVALALSVVLALLQPLLFAALLVVLPPMIIAGRILAGQVRRHSERWRDAFGVFSVRTQLGLRAMTLTRTLGVGAQELELRRREHRTLGEAGVQMAWRQAAFSGTQAAIGASAGVILLVLGGIEVIHHQMSLGTLLSVYAVLGLLLRQLSVIVVAIPQVVSAQESLRRLELVLGAEESEPYTGARTIAFDGSLDVDRVTFAYGDRDVLRDLSLQIRPGRQLAVVGPNGAGKTTLLRLLLGLYRPQHGVIRAGGVEYGELDMVALRHEMGIVLQDPLIFHGSIDDNVRAGRAEITDAVVTQALASATATEFIERLPEGRDTVVGEEGENLSGGQRQRLAIARALVGRPRVLLLDEPTTHLDDDAVRRLLLNLRAQPDSPAVVVISHDPHVAELSDDVVYLREGRAQAPRRATASV